MKGRQIMDFKMPQFFIETIKCKCRKWKSSLRLQGRWRNLKAKGHFRKIRKMWLQKNDETSGPLRSRSRWSMAVFQSTLQTSGPPQISLSGTFEHRYKTPSVQLARPFCNTHKLFFFVLKHYSFSLLISITALDENQVNLTNQHHSLLFGVGFSWQGGSKNPFFQNVGNKNPFPKKPSILLIPQQHNPPKDFP